MTKKIKYLRRAVEKLVGSELGEKRGKEFETLIFDLVEKKVERSGVELSVEDTYKKTAYEKVGHLFFILGVDRDGETAAEEDPEARKKKIRRLKREISDEVDGWDCLVFVDHEARFLRTMEKGVMKPEAVTNVYFCKNKRCVVKNQFFVWRLQTRSADEPETTFFQCAHCGLRGRHG